MTDKATIKVLSEIHGKLAQSFLHKLETHPDDITPAELNTIRQFLKDNDISCDPEQNEDVNKILHLIPKFDKDEVINL